MGHEGKGDIAIMISTAALNPLLAPELAAMDGVRHGFFTREGGVSTGLYAGLNTGLGSDDDRAHVTENRRRIAQYLGVEASKLMSPHQTHGRDVYVAETPWLPGAGPKVDGLVTKMPGLALGVGAADCGPLLFADGQAGVIGAAHSGWRGAYLDIISAVVEAMEGLGAQRSSICAVLGPTISQRSYEVGPEFRQKFLDQSTGFERFFIPSSRSEHHYFDLPAFIEHRALAAGVGLFKRFDLCTYLDPTRFFSYRRATHRQESDYGRMMSAIVLRSV